MLPLIKYSDKNDAIRRANATTYGLGASVWSSDINGRSRLLRLEHLRGVWIDEFPIFLDECRRALPQKTLANELRQAIEIQSRWLNLSATRIEP